MAEDYDPAGSVYITRRIKLPDVPVQFATCEFGINANIRANINAPYDIIRINRIYGSAMLVELMADLQGFAARAGIAVFGNLDRDANDEIAQQPVISDLGDTSEPVAETAAATEPEATPAPATGSGPMKKAAKKAVRKSAPRIPSA